MRTSVMVMDLLLTLIVLMIALGVGGFYAGGIFVGATGAALIIFMGLLLFFTGGLKLYRR